MRPHIDNPYRPPEFALSEDPAAPIQLPADLPAAGLADALHTQLTRLAGGRDLRVLRRQARRDFRAVMRHARARRLDGHAFAPLDIRRREPRQLSAEPPRRHGLRRHPGAAPRAVKAKPSGRRSRAGL